LGTLSLGDMLTEIKAGLGNRTDAGVSTPALVNAINLAQQRIERVWPWKDLRQLQLAQMSFTGNPAVDKYLSVPAGTKTIHSFVLLDTSAGQASLGMSGKLRQMPWRWFDNLYPSPEWIVPGWPQRYAWWGKFIVMVPPPFLQFTAQLRCTMMPTAFTVANLSQKSDFEDKDDIIINWTLGYKHRSYGRLDRATYHENLVNELVHEAIEFDDQQPDLELTRDLGGEGPVANIPYWQNPFVGEQP
jgi:hypothetical protein